MQIAFPALLFLVFLILKLTGVIAWSWWWVTAPLWLGAVLLIGILIGVGALAAIFGPSTRRRRF